MSGRLPVRLRADSGGSPYADPLMASASSSPFGGTSSRVRGQSAARGGSPQWQAPAAAASYSFGSPSATAGAGGGGFQSGSSSPRQPVIVSVTEDASAAAGGSGGDELVAMLHGALHHTKGQLKAALEELATVQSKYRTVVAASSAAGSPPNDYQLRLSSPQQQYPSSSASRALLASEGGDGGGGTPWRGDSSSSSALLVDGSGRGQPPASPRTVVVDEEVIIAKEAARLFRLYEVPFTVEEVQNLLDRSEASAATTAVSGGGGGDDYTGTTHRRQQQQRTVLHQISHSLALREELDACQSELVEAHDRIDELSFALDLEQRHVAQLRFNQMSASSQNADVLINSEAAKQAAEEIAFLCDTLAATREEADHTKSELQTARLERDAALAAFAELKTRSEDLLAGCFEISETAKVDADTSVAVVMQHLKAKDKELHVLRNSFAQHKIVADDQKKLKMAIEKELIEIKTKNLSLKETATKLSEEHRRSTVTIADLRGRVTHLKGVIAASAAAASASTPLDTTTTVNLSTNNSFSGTAMMAAASGRGQQGDPAGAASAATGKSGNRRGKADAGMRTSSAPSRGRSEASDEDATDGSPAEDEAPTSTTPRGSQKVQPAAHRSMWRGGAGLSSPPLRPAASGTAAPVAAAAAAGGSSRLLLNIPRSFRRPVGDASPQGSSKATKDLLRTLSPAGLTAGPRSVLLFPAPAEAGQDSASPTGDPAGDAADALDFYRTEYDEMKACLLLLAPKVPGANTARDVTSGLLTGLEKITVHCQKVETELRKRSTQFQVLKRQHTEAREQVEALERKVAHVSLLEKKIESKDRLLDKLKKENAAQCADYALRRTVLDVTLAEKASELERLRAELASAQLELTEGRELMLQLIKESTATVDGAAASPTGRGKSQQAVAAAA